MARYIGPVCKLCRSEATKLFIKGHRCYTDKCALERRGYLPGEHGRTPRKASDYGLQLREKQKVRRIYGILERQFKNYFKLASRQPGNKGENLLRLLERRLDNVVFQLGFATSRAEARQMVRHRHILVNDRLVDIPSYLVKAGGKISIKAKSRKMDRVQEALELAKTREMPSWLEVDPDKLIGRVLKLPSQKEIGMPIKGELVVEFYSR